MDHIQYILGTCISENEDTDPFLWNANNSLSKYDTVYRNSLSYSQAIPQAETKIELSSSSLSFILLENPDLLQRKSYPSENRYIRMELTPRRIQPNPLAITTKFRDYIIKAHVYFDIGIKLLFSQ